MKPKQTIFLITIQWKIKVFVKSESNWNINSQLLFMLHFSFKSCFSKFSS